MIEQYHQPIGRLHRLAVAVPSGSRYVGEVTAKQVSGCLCLRRNRSCRGCVAGQEQVVREHDPIAGLDRQHLVPSVGVERDEGQRRRRPRVANGLLSMLDDEITTG